MAMKRCPVCGEKYSDTYKDCPLCEEEAALMEGEKIRRSGRRVSHGRQYSLITPTLIVLILIMAALLVYLLYGDELAQKLRGGQEENTPPTEDITPVKPEVPAQTDETEPNEEPGGVMPEGPDDTTEPSGTGDQPTTTQPAAQTDYEKLSKLPGGLTLSTTDFTLRTAGETHTIQVSGGSGTYTWASEDEGVASVDQSGKVTAISKGTVNIVVSDGSKKGTCIVRCNVSGTAAPPSTTPTTAPNTSSGTLKAGAATVVNGGNGVRVRSGPGTNYDILASVPNGADIQIVESAGDGWYKITFSDVGGAATPGYMKGEFLQNQ